MNQSRTEKVTVHINGHPAARGILTQTKEYIRVESEGPHTDPNWEHTDERGHYHAYSADISNHYPTLNQTSEHVSCDGSCGGTCDGEGYSRTIYTCRACRQTVAPGTVRGLQTNDIPGIKDWSLTIDKGIYPDNDMTLSVRLDGAHNTYFGLAVVANFRLESDGTGETELLGNGPLGIRPNRSTRTVLPGQPNENTPCTRTFNAGQVLGRACPDCRHTNLVHPGGHNPDIRQCVLCILDPERGDHG